jgi:hypothetical protein
MAFPEITKATKNPLQTKDEWIIRPVIPYQYTDMRGHVWLVRWHGQGWTANAPAGSPAQKAYELPADDGRGGPYLFAGATDARGLIDLIEEKIELARQSGQSPGDFYGARPSSGFPWWLILIGLWALGRKKR